jgi:hypothetical protein
LPEKTLESIYFYIRYPKNEVGMKKVFVLVPFVILIAACTKTDATYKQEIVGSWTLYKYLFRNADQTHQFDSIYQGYMISFTAAGAFIETDTTGLSNSGTYHFTSNNKVLALDYPVPHFVDSVLVDTNIERQYTIFNLNSASVQLRNDSSELYLQKIQP